MATVRSLVTRVLKRQADVTGGNKTDGMDVRRGNGTSGDEEY